MSEITSDGFHEIDPSEEGVTPNGTKSLPPFPTGNAAVDKRLLDAWAVHIKNGYDNSDRLFSSVLNAYMKPYWITVILYVAMFVLGLGLFAVAAYLSIGAGQVLAGLVFGGLSVGVFLSFFLNRPLHALEQNQAFMTWLGVCYNTYWTRLGEARDPDPDKILASIKDASDDFEKSINRLLDKHQKLAGKRPGSTIGNLIDDSPKP